jgi:hypothetical protein
MPNTLVLTNPQGPVFSGREATRRRLPPTARLQLFSLLRSGKACGGNFTDEQAASFAGVNVDTACAMLGDDFRIVPADLNESPAPVAADAPVDRGRSEGTIGAVRAAEPASETVNLVEDVHGILAELRSEDPATRAEFCREFRGVVARLGLHRPRALEPAE